MSAFVEVPSSWFIARIVLFHADAAAARFDLEDLGLRASRYAVPESLVPRIRALEQRHPLQVGTPDPDLVERGRRYRVLGPIGPDEERVLDGATHGVGVVTRASPTDWCDAHAAVISFSRGLASAVDGVVLDPLLGTFRPIADHTAPMNPDDPVPLPEVTRSMSIPSSKGRWLVRTFGMANVGLPELFFDDVQEQDVPAAAALMRRARMEIVRLLALGPGTHPVEPLRLGGHPARVGLTPASCPWSGNHGLRLHADGAPAVPLGRILSSPAHRQSPEA